MFQKVNLSILFLVTLVGCSTKLLKPNTSHLLEDSETSVLEMYRNSSLVASARADLTARGFSEALGITVSTLKAGCGFAGCDTTEIITESLGTSFGANDQRSSIVALVTLPALNNATLSLAEIKETGDFEEVEVESRDPEVAFTSSEAVNGAVATVKSEGFSEAGEITVHSIDGGCGFAGCEDRFLVSQTFHTAGPNTQSTSVLATVKTQVPGSNPSMKVALTSINPKEEQLQNALFTCSDGEEDGLRLKIYQSQGKTSKATLEKGPVDAPTLVANMNVCSDLEFDPTNPTDGPWTTIACNNTDWVNRYNMSYVVFGFQPDKAYILYNEAEFATLICQP